MWSACEMIVTCFCVCTKKTGFTTARMNAGTPDGQQLARCSNTGCPASTRSLSLRNSSRTQGWRIGFVRSATGKVDCSTTFRLGRALKYSIAFGT